MRLVTPYETAAALINDLDNGGRWFNFFTRKHDGVVEEAELKKAAGAWTLSTASLYLAMASVGFSDRDRVELDRALDFALRPRLVPPQWLRPETLTAALAPIPVIVAGRLRFREHTEVTSYTTTTTTDADGNTTTTTTPSTTQYAICVLEDPDADAAPVVALAGSRPLADGLVRLGGSFQRSVVDDRGRTELLLDLKFYTPLERGSAVAPGERWLTAALGHRVS